MEVIIWTLFAILLTSICGRTVHLAVCILCCVRERFSNRFVRWNVGIFVLFMTAKQRITFRRLQPDEFFKIIFRMHTNRTE